MPVLTKTHPSPVTVNAMASMFKLLVTTSRGIFFAIAALGKTANQVAFERTSLPTVLAKLPSGVYIAADAAYTLPEVCMVPYTG